MDGHEGEVDERREGRRRSAVLVFGDQVLGLLEELLGRRPGRPCCALMRWKSGVAWSSRRPRRPPNAPRDDALGLVPVGQPVLRVTWSRVFCSVSFLVHSQSERMAFCGSSTICSPSSIALARTTSSSALRSGTLPISLRYIRTGSSMPIMSAAIASSSSWVGSSASRGELGGRLLPRLAVWPRRRRRRRRARRRRPGRRPWPSCSSSSSLGRRRGRRRCRGACRARARLATSSLSVGSWAHAGPPGLRSVTGWVRRCAASSWRAMARSSLAAVELGALALELEDLLLDAVATWWCRSAASASASSARLKSKQLVEPSSLEASAGSGRAPDRAPPRSRARGRRGRRACARRPRASAPARPGTRSGRTRRVGVAVGQDRPPAARGPGS